MVQRKRTGTGASAGMARYAATGNKKMGTRKFNIGAERGVEGARTMNDEQETKHAFARSRSNAGLYAILNKAKKLFSHRHGWKDSGWNQWSIATEQRCKCGAYRHHLWTDVRGDDIAWRDGKHPNACNVELRG